MTPHFPLSRSQERVWFEHLRDPHECAFNDAIVLDLEGPLDRGVLCRSLAEIVRRHDALRATFDEHEGRPVQRILSTPRAWMTVVDASASALSCRDTVRDWMIERPFDLERGPLVRCALIAFGPAHHALVIVTHHLVCDGLSSLILMNELKALYDAATQGTALPPAPPLSYAAFAEWDRAAAASRSQEPRPAVSAPAEPLPFRDHMHSASAAGDSREIDITGDLLVRLKALARREATTLSNVLLAAFRVLLHKYGTRELVPIGMALSTRRRTEHMTAIGLFTDAAVIELRASSAMPFTELQRDVTRQAFEAYARYFKGASEPSGRTPDVRLAWSYQAAVPGTQVLADGVRVSFVNDAQKAGAPVDLRGLAFESPAAVRLRLVGRRGLFEGATLERMLDGWRLLLEQITETPDRPVGDLSILTTTQRRTLIEHGRTRDHRQPDRVCIDDLRDAAEAAPDRIAVTCGDHALTYGELTARSNQLARYLRGCGVGADVPVAICVNRSLELIVAILGVVRAGGTYLPIDPAYPPRRVEFMLDDAQPAVIVTERAIRDGLPNVPALTVSIDEDWPEIAAHPVGDLAGDPGVDIHPLHCAYAIHTSGSTGTPKRVGVTHRGLANLATAQRRVFHIDESSVVLQFASPAFDAAVSEWSTALCAGARLVLLPPTGAAPGEELLSLLRREQVTTATIPPAVLGVLPDDPLPALETLIVAGEACPPAIVARWAPGRRMLNAYGPTEVTVCASMTEAPLVADGDRPPIGVPIANSDLYVLDRDLEPVPVSAAGHLYVGGTGVARGYLGRPDLTAERFVPDPFSREGGARLYRTGDRVRWRHDGQLDFAGRLDDQLKVRGYRIEPGEVEAVLAQHAGVRQAVVDVRGDEAHEARLVAFVVRSEAAARTGAAELRQWASTRLPAHLVPGVFVFLDALPLTPSGKVQRQALPAIDPAAEGDIGYAAPSTPTEEMVAGIWADVLGLTRVGRRDVFFDLGGHSLLATQVTSRVCAAFQIDLPVRVIFDAPVLADYAAQIQDDIGAAAGRAEPPIVAVPRARALPLSFAQQRLWVIDRTEPDSALYNMPFAVRLRGALDRPALGESLRDLVRRHEILRTSFGEEDGVGVQVVEPSCDMEPVEIDLRSLPVAAREEAARARAREEARRPFDLGRAPLMRVMLIQLADDDHVLLVTLHHIVTDAWSAAIMIREFGLLYDARSRQAPPALEEPPRVQYADFAVWQRALMNAESWRELETWWRTQLADAVPLSLPGRHHASGAVSYEGARVPVSIAAAVTGQLKMLAKRESATLFMTLLAAVQALLFRYTSQNDISIGTLLAGRRRPEVERVAGFFVNTVALRAHVEGAASFRQAIARARELMLDVYRHQDMPFERLVELLRPARAIGRTPLVQVMCILQNAPEETLALSNLTLTQEPFDQELSRFELTIEMKEEDGALRGSIQYRTALFEPAFVTGFARALERLLAAAAADPDRPIAALPILTGDERREVVEIWNATARKYPARETMHALIEAQVARTPGAPAVVFGGETLTCAELNARANRLARHLRRMGAGVETPVGVCLERSFDLVVALLAVLKAGGAYVPLDPAHPAERLRQIVGEAGITIVITHARVPMPSAVRDEAGVRIVRLEDDAEAIARESADDLPAVAGDANVAYVLYTSGSTGQPKGAAISHASLCNHMRWLQELLELRHTDRVLQKTPFSFAASVWEFFAPLWTGAVLVMAPAGAHKDPAALVAEIERHGVTVLQLVPSMLHVLIDEPRLRHQRTLRIVCCGGEALSSALCERLTTTLGGGVTVINLYGPTEATIDCSSETFVPGLDAPMVSIGRPIANTQLYVLDAAGEPAGAGMVGELCVAGAGLARGYWRRPDLTALRFVPNPFGASGDRLYRTGDRARYRADGRVDYLGRLDSQIKLRGARVELGEIEAVVSAHAAVRQCAAIVREEAPRLAAFVTCRPGAAEGDLDGLRAWVQARLPDYMVPAVFVVRDELPLLSNGKVDRKALRNADLGAGVAAATAAYVAPRDETERILSEVWAHVLGLPRVGVTDNFFSLGGDSILSIQAAAHAHQAGVAITPRQLFEHQTVAELAAFVKNTGAAETAALPFAAGPETGVVPLTPIQQWFFEHQAGRRDHFNQSVLLASRAPLDLAHLRHALDVAAAPHASLRLRFRRHDNGPWEQSYGDEPPPRAAVVDLSAMGGTAARQRAALEHSAAALQRSLDLANGPMMRAVVFITSEGSSRLLIVVHHLAIDGISWRILLDDFQSAYARLMAGQPIEARPRTASFQTWATQLAAHAQSEGVRRESRYWLARPFGRLRRLGGEQAPANTIAAEETIRGELNDADTRALLQHAPRLHGAHVQELLLAALAEAIARWSGPGDLLVDVEGHGREQDLVGANVTRTIGWFTTQYPVLLRDPGGHGLRARLARVKEDVRGIPRRGLGYGLLRYAAADDGLREALRRQPAAEIRFNYLGQFDQLLAGGLFEPTPESAGPERDPNGARTHAIDITASIVAGRFTVLWHYSRAQHEPRAIEALSRFFLHELIAIAGDEGLGLTQHEWKEVLTRVGTYQS